MIRNNSSILLSVLIPVYNSEKTISRLVEELIRDIAPMFRLEIVLVNDNSCDRSEEVCIALFYKYKETIKYYSLAKNVGEHNAVMAGLNRITGDYVVIMDDDFQNPTSEVLKLVDKALNDKCDVVYSYYDEKKHPFFRNLGSRFNDKAANLMLKKPKDLYMSSFKLLNKFLVNEIVKYKAPFPYIDGIILQITDHIGKVKVEHSSRKEGRSGYTFRKLVSLWLNMFTNFSILPLRISIVLGLILASLGFVFGVSIAVEKFLNPNVPLGFTSLFVSISVFGGIQLIMLGMVGEYIGRIFLSLNKKPQYTIKKAFEHHD
ncbi:glycosyltransferase [candidate division WS5 bacterium]|uniref:Glycosyltransferase n=1 Tax=candidate division WS5 bacterium TaxID=2093353 RepID=A0A419D9J5_9BACT|nr:MAG: glycosyltransferase [candidate division WS5 bacterium]